MRVNFFQGKTKYGFRSKKKTGNAGYPDFFKECGDYVIVVEAKADNYALACEEMQFYIENNKRPDVDMIGIAISGQNEFDYSARLSIKLSGHPYKVIVENGKLQNLSEIKMLYTKEKYSDFIGDDELVKVLNRINKIFQCDIKVKDTHRSLFFSGIMIALTDDSFRNTYRSTKEPSQEEIRTKKWFVCHKLNENILTTISDQISTKVNNLSKEYNWKDCFSFIRNIDYDLNKYIELISYIEEYIFIPYTFNQKSDILGKAYKIFLSKAGKIDNKNIILTPEHIKQLMIELAELKVDDVLLDTCTGSGGFLMEGMETMIKLAKNDTNLIKNIKEKQLIGFEVDPTLYALACTNMFLHKDGRSNLIYHDSLISQSNYPDIYDEIINNIKPHKCVINPPYENNSSIKFLSVALHLIQKYGKVIIIMPTPTLNNNKEIVKKLLTFSKLDFVIKMPNNLFSEQGRTVNTSIFGFTKTPHDKDDEVIFYNMEDDGLVSVQHKGRIDKNSKWKNCVHPAVLEALCITKKNTSNINNNISRRRIFDDNGNVNFYGYKETSESSNYVKFSDLFDLGKKNNGIKGTLQSENAIDGEFDFITASEVWKTSDTYEYKNGECLVYAVSAAGSLGRCHYVKGSKPYIVSNLCIVLKPKNVKKYPVNLQFYEIYLNKIRKQIANELADGTSKLTLKPNELGEYLIEYFDIEYQNKVAKEYEEAVIIKKAECEKSERDFYSRLNF